MKHHLRHFCGVNHRAHSYSTQEQFSTVYSTLCISVILQYFHSNELFLLLSKNKPVPSWKATFDILQVISLLTCYTRIIVAI